MPCLRLDPLGIVLELFQLKFAYLLHHLGQINIVREWIILLEEESPLFVPLQVPN